MRFLLQFLEDAGRRPLSSYKTRRERLHRPDRVVCPLDLSREVFGGNFLLTSVIVSLLVFLGLLEFVLPGAGGWFTSRGQGSRCWRMLSALERPSSSASPSGTVLLRWFLFLLLSGEPLGP